MNNYVSRNEKARHLCGVYFLNPEWVILLTHNIALSGLLSCGGILLPLFRPFGTYKTEIEKRISIIFNPEGMTLW